jgi:hypothetical protein
LVSGSFFEETALNRFRHPEGTRLPALERNILKFRLNKKIVAQMEARRKNAGILRGELSLKDTGFENEEMYPAHPRNISDSGNLSKRGVEVCFRLFDLGKRPIVVAYLMYISAKAARKRHKQWLEAGGINRKRYEIGPLFAKPIRVR